MTCLRVSERSAGGKRKGRAQQKRKDAPSLATSCYSCRMSDVFSSFLVCVSEAVRYSTVNFHIKSNNLN